jgi:hypothetical protein
MAWQALSTLLASWPEVGESSPHSGPWSSNPIENAGTEPQLSSTIEPVARFRLLIAHRRLSLGLVVSSAGLCYNHLQLRES